MTEPRDPYVSWDIRWNNRAIRDLRQISAREQERIVNAVEQLATTGSGDLLPLQGRPGQWRLRVGQYRVIFAYELPFRILKVERVLPRDRAYRR